MIDQVTVFIENEKGHLAALCRALADAGVNMSVLTVADTASYGVVRLLADEPEKAVDALVSAGYRAKLTRVFAIEIPNVPGGLAVLLEAFDEAGINLEYAYCFASDKEKAIEIFRVEDGQSVEQITKQLGYRLVEAVDL
jgi:hypothetical protein